MAVIRQPAQRPSPLAGVPEGLEAIFAPLIAAKEKRDKEVEEDKQRTMETIFFQDISGAFKPEVRANAPQLAEPGNILRRGREIGLTVPN
ncbi:hypothetical protein LCGC14_3036550, partial [marine sediment metagenome]